MCEIETINQGANNEASYLFYDTRNDPYESLIEPSIADLDNAPKGGFAGSITAALFLRRFVPLPSRYIHFDIYGWNPKKVPGRPQGGALQGPRAISKALKDIFE